MTGACSFNANELTISGKPTNLVATLENPPKTRVILSVTGSGGFHRELVWDPTVGEGLRHDVLLPTSSGNPPYTLLAHAEEDRVQASQLVVLTSTQFVACENVGSTRATCPGSTAEEIAKCEACSETNAKKGLHPTNTGLLVSSLRRLIITPETKVVESTSNKSTTTTGGPVTMDKMDRWTPRIRLVCEGTGSELADMQLANKQLFAASVSRGFLDQAVPAPVTEALALLAEIAIERAKSSALDLVRKRFVGPICDKLDLRLLGLGNYNDRAFPRACALLESLRFEDLLSAGRNLVDAARDDVRLTLVPRLVERAKLPPVARDVALMALELGNRLLEGGGDDVTDLDLLLTQLDRLVRRGALADVDGVKDKFIDSILTLPAAKAHLIGAAIDLALPADPGELLSDLVAVSAADTTKVSLLGLRDLAACKRLKDTERWFIAADKRACVQAVRDRLAASINWFVIVKQLVTTDQLLQLISESRRYVGATAFEGWLEGFVKDANNIRGYLGLLTEDVRRSCAVRVTIAIVKWCSGRDVCTASNIAAAFEDPESLFHPPKSATDLREHMCWTSKVLKLPDVRAPYIELATRAMGFLRPPAKGEERARVTAVLRWVFAVARTLDGNATSLTQLEELLDLFEKRDYVRAIAQTMKLAVEGMGCDGTDCEPPVELRKALNLVGAIASYVQVYNDTKTADPAEAKAARKKAIESLIDSSTDRSERGRTWVVGLGSNVSLSSTWADEVPHEFALRVPLGVSFQHLPPGDAASESGPGSPFGFHFALQAADLGQFIRSDSEDVTWASFVAPGVELGLLFGTPKRLFSVVGHASYAPALVDDGAPTWRLGVAVGYYVPFFDLN